MRRYTILYINSDAKGKGMPRFFLILFLFFPLYSQATIVNNNPLRDVYLQAEKNSWQSNSAHYKNLYSQLAEYPLRPYLDQKHLLNSFSIKQAPKIEAFLLKYRGTPLDWSLRKKWLKYLAKRNRQSMFISFYVPSGDVDLTCKYLRYRLNKGAPESEIMPEVSQLWLKGKSQPKACDPLFNRWEKAGLRTEEIVWERIKLAADGGQHTLIPYLIKLLPNEKKYLGHLWLNIRRNPNYLTRFSRFKKFDEDEAEIITYGLQRLIWRSPKRAVNSYKKAQKKFPFSEEQKQAIEQKFALALASKNHKQANVWLSELDDEAVDKRIAQWRIANALRGQNWFTIKKVLEELPKNHHESMQWRYWFARSLLATNHKEEGHKQLTVLAKERHYYGFLAASIITQPFVLNDEPIEITEIEKQEVMKDPAIQRAFELFSLERFNQARKEWNYALSNLNDNEKLILAKIANEGGWYDRAIFTLANVGYLHDVDLRFPLAFSGDISSFAKKNKIKASWVFAIARRESSFMSDASSPVSAKGLMQVMPATAKQLTRQNITTSFLLDAQNSIRLGSKFLRKLLDKNNGNTVLATASYNAGPYRVGKWLKNMKEIPADMWIETIPYKETREYVKSVMAYQQIYEYKLTKKSSLFDDLVRLRIKPSKP